MAVLCIVFRSLLMAMTKSTVHGIVMNSGSWHPRSTYGLQCTVHTQSSTYYDYLADLHPCRVLEFSPY